MKRRSFLATTAMGATVGVSGCLEGKPVAEVNTSERISAHSGWVRDIKEPDGSGEIGYTVKSEHSRFEVFYFRDASAFRTYEQCVFGNEEIPEDQPRGYSTLGLRATQNEGGVYEAKMPADGSRHQLDFDGTHYFVVDNSNYGTIGVESMTENLPVVINLEVVEDRF
jgi:hypothetical protein